jgi:putative peptidoglycan lipid II flippase
MAVLAQAAGVASMPFFASLWAKGQKFEFANGVADSVSRVAAMGILVASALIALAVPVVQLIFLGGKFSASDARVCAGYFAMFCLAMFLWSAQSIYARAFYAAGNTFLPMVAGTIVTVVSLPVYAGLYRAWGAMGLAVASDVGITLQTLVLAVLLHQKRMVSLASLDYRELGRCVLAAVAAGLAVWLVFTWSLTRLEHALAWNPGGANRLRDLAILAAGSAGWLLIARWVLEKTGSALPRVVMKRLKLS